VPYTYGRILVFKDRAVRHVVTSGVMMLRLAEQYGYGRHPGGRGRGTRAQADRLSRAFVGYIVHNFICCVKCKSEPRAPIAEEGVPATGWDRSDYADHFPK
jgi:hypothetical protein